MPRAVGEGREAHEAIYGTSRPPRGNSRRRERDQTRSPSISVEDRSRTPERERGDRRRIGRDDYGDSIHYHETDYPQRGQPEEPSMGLRAIQSEQDLSRPSQSSGNNDDAKLLSVRFKPEQQADIFEHFKDVNKRLLSGYMAVGILI